MLLRHRGTLTLVTLLVLACVMVAGAFWVLNAHVDPATASRASVMRYLVLSEVSAEPLSVQQAWVNRLQKELTSDDLPASGSGAKLSAAYRERLARNIDTLQVVWFKTRTAEYAQLPETERESFMVEQLAVVGSWAKVASLMDAGPISADVATKKLIERINAWVQAASGTERDQMVAAVKDGTVCWLSTTDLSDKPLGMKRELARHLAKELDKGAKPKVGGLVTDTSRREQLVANATQLVEAYIYSLAEQYAALSQDERMSFIDAQLAAVERWGIAELLAGSGAPASRATAALALAKQSQAWVEHAPAEERPQVQTFVTAVQQRLVWKQLPAWMRGRS